MVLTLPDLSNARWETVTGGYLSARIGSQYGTTALSAHGYSWSIGVGQFIHLAMRRNLPIIYIIEDNGVYGLTKGQFSATAEWDRR